MKFSCRSRSFSQNEKEKDLPPRSHTISQPKVEPAKEYDIRRTSSNNSYDEDKSQGAYSVFSMGEHHQKTTNDAASSSSHHRDHAGKSSDANSKANKVYFKQIVDLEQNTREPAIKKSLHQILVRFGVSRIKDVKKQAMM